jgi:hypothetical protein
MMVSAVSPWRIALWRERCFSVTGLVLSWALRRLPAIWRDEVIVPPVRQLALFRDLEAALLTEPDLPGLCRR